MYKRKNLVCMETAPELKNSHIGFLKTMSEICNTFAVRSKIGHKKGVKQFKGILQNLDQGIKIWIFKNADSDF